MIKLIVITICMSFGAKAQSIRQLLGINQNPTQIRVSWNCPQHTYPQVRHLRQSADVKIEFTENNGQLSVKLKPDVFKVNPLNLNNALGLINKTQVSLDYSQCLDNFKRSALLAIEMKRESSLCSHQSQHRICNETTDSLEQAISNKIENAPYFKNRKNQMILPRILPGVSSGDPDEDILMAFNQFKNNESYNPLSLFSAEAIKKIQTNSNQLNQTQLKEYQQALIRYNQTTQNEICATASALCNHIAQNSKNTEAKVETIVEQIIAKLKSIDDTYLRTLNIPKDETQAIQAMREILETKPFDCNLMNRTYESEGRQFIATLFPKAISENIDRLSAVADRECIDGIIQNYVLAMNYRPENNKAFQEYCSKNETDVCKLGEERVTLMNDNFRRLFGIQFGERGDRYIEQIGGVACFINQESIGSNLYQFLNDHRANLSCIELKPGEVKNVNHRDGAPSGLSGAYVLKKKDNGDHEVRVNIDVVADGYGVSKNEMHSRIQSCMTEASPFMKGPDGKKLEFNIITPEQAKKLPINEQPTTNKVSIQAPGTRSNSMSYKSDIDCPTIAHEVLHLLGLCDEYNGVGDGYTCRTVSKVPSIMSSQGEAYRQGISRTHTCECRPGSICERVQRSNDPDLKRFYLHPSVYSLTDSEMRNKYCEYSDIADSNWQSITKKQSVVITNQSETSLTFNSQNMGDYPWPRVGLSRFKCSCSDPNDSECKDILSQVAENINKIDQFSLESCPSGSFSKKQENGELIDSPAIWSDKGVQFVQKAKLPSLIHPNHYERIIGGACATKATKYNECAIWAYRKKELTNNCAGKPAHCENGKEFLGLDK